MYKDRLEKARAVQIEIHCMKANMLLITTKANMLSVRTILV